MTKDILLRLNLLMLSIIFVGCETLNTNFEYSQRSSDITKFAVEIISEPTGAKIEINDDYVGKTPITVELEGWEATRTFIRRHTIIAHPVQAGGYTQVKMFSGWYKADHSYGDVIPKQIYFNMSLRPSPQKYDIDINKK